MKAQGWKICQLRRGELTVVAAFDKLDRLKLRLLFPALAQRGTFMWLLLSSAACSGGLDGPATHSHILCQMLLSLQRENRL
jgi:hypothetical protein